MKASLVVFYPCLDIEAITAFYRDHLGLEVFDDQGLCKIFDTGYGYLGFCEYDDHILATKTCISFELSSKEEVDAYYQRCLLKNDKILQIPKKHDRFGVYSFFIEDPNGYRLEFQKILN